MHSIIRKLYLLKRFKYYYYYVTLILTTPPRKAKCLLLIWQVIKSCIPITLNMFVDIENTSILSSCDVSINYTCSREVTQFKTCFLTLKLGRWSDTKQVRKHRAHPTRQYKDDDIAYLHLLCLIEITFSKKPV